MIVKAYRGKEIKTELKNSFGNCLASIFRSEGDPIIYHITPRSMTQFRHLWELHKKITPIIAQITLHTIKKDVVLVHPNGQELCLSNRCWPISSYYLPEHLVAIIPNELPQLLIYYILHVFRASSLPSFHHTKEVYWLENSLQLVHKGFKLEYAMPIAHMFSGNTLRAANLGHLYIPISLQVDSLRYFASVLKNIHEGEPATQVGQYHNKKFQLRTFRFGEVLTHFPVKALDTTIVKELLSELEKADDVHT